MKVVIAVLSFLARHLLFVLLAMLVGCVIWTVAYLVLFVIAMLADQGLGGPLAYPAGLMAIVVACAVIGWGFFAPASAVGALFCGLLKWPRLWAIPLVTLTVLVLCYLVSWPFVEMGVLYEAPSFWMVLKNFAIYLSVPLGVYWWLTEGPGALFEVLRDWVQRRRGGR